LGKIFNRTHKVYDIYEAELRSWESSSLSSKKAMAKNLRHDHRVTRKRERKFRKYFIKHSHDLSVALKKYHQYEVQGKTVPGFCQRSCDNFIADYRSASCTTCDGFKADIKLATIINLNGLEFPITDTKKDSLKSWSVYETSGYKDNFSKWLDENLSGKSDKERLEFLDAIFDVLNFRLKKGKFYHPTWVTEWDEFESYAKKTDGSFDIDNWNQIVGVPRMNPSWQIVIQYPANIINGCLYRPTQLDGGDYPHHFPSPPQAEMAEGGYTMDLGITVSRPLNEFIHTQIRLTTDYWENSGYLIGKTNPQAYDLAALRENHHNKLKIRYNSKDIDDWMPAWI
jgi:hypothetical protein